MSTELAHLQSRASTYRDYPIELKASIIAAIEANGGNVLATAKLFNIPQDTAYYWWRNSERFCEIQKTEAAKDLASKLEVIANSTADSLANHDMQVVTARDKAAVLSVVIDKMQLLRGNPTSIALNVEKNELTLVLSGALSNALDLPEAIDVTPVESTD